MATQPTQNAVSSESTRDLKFNAGKIDEFVTSVAQQYVDRFGQAHYTIEGLRKLAQGAIAAFGYITMDSFQDGATLTLPNQVLRDEATGEYFRWDGTFPKEIPEDSTPKSSGGVGLGKWLSIGDAVLRSMLAKISGAGMVGYNFDETYPTYTVGGAIKTLDNKIEVTSEQLSEETDQKINDLSTFNSPRGGNLASDIKSAITNLGNVGRSGIFATPDEFTTRLGVKIHYRKDSSGQAFLINKLDKFKPAGAFVRPFTVSGSGLKAYYVKQNGNNSAVGTSWDTAFASVAVAYQKGDADVIFVMAGNYFSTFNLGTYTSSRNVSIQGVGGPVNFISGPATGNLGAWTATSTAGVYKQGVSDSALFGVVALDYQDSSGNPYTLKPSVDNAGVVATPGSFFRNSSTGELFVSMPDLAAPSTNVYYYNSSPMRVAAPGCRFHHSDITYIGGNSGAFSARLGNTSTIIFGERIGCCGQVTGDGWQIKDVGISIAIDCRASRNGNDGFNYHALNDIDPHFLEINCIGTDNFSEGTGNGSTCHEAVKGIRINCHYYGNYGPGVSDVADTQTYNIGCTSRKNGVTANSNASGFQTSAQDKTGSGCKQWLDGCVADGNSGGDFVSILGAKMYYRDIWSGTDTVVNDADSSAEKYST